MQDIGQFALVVSCPGTIGFLAVEVIKVDFPKGVHEAGHDDDPARSTGFQFIEKKIGQQKMTCGSGVQQINVY